MSRNRNCGDNALMERFLVNWETKRVCQQDYANHADAINDIADCIVGSQNSTRLHPTLGNVSRNAFERESASKNLSYYPKLLDHCRGRS